MIGNKMTDASPRINLANHQSNHTSHTTTIHAASRYNIFALPHKALRAWMAHVLVQSGRIDWQDNDDSARLLSDIRNLAAACRTHLHIENQFIHPAMEARQPGSSRHGVTDHHEHEVAITGLLSDCEQLERSQATARTVLGQALYARLALFIAENLAHMAMEEVDHNAVLWRHYSDTEITAIEQALAATIAPEKAMNALRWMLVAATSAERAKKLLALRSRVPAEAFLGILTMIQPLLNATDWHKLQLALQLSTPVAERDPAELDAYSNQQRTRLQVVA